MKTLTEMLIVGSIAGLLGCSNHNSFIGDYQRINASAFETMHGMNQAVQIKTEGEVYKVTFVNSYGLNSFDARPDGDHLKTNNDMVMRKTNTGIEVFYLENPDVVFQFVKEGVKK